MLRSKPESKVVASAQYAAESTEIEVSKAVYSIDGSAGGDRVEKLEGSDGRLHFIVLDACGHGANAAETADVALNSIRALTSPGGVTAARLISRIRQVAGGAFDDDVAAMIVQVSLNRSSEQTKPR